MKILLTGHACSPYRGSEASLTWNWAWHLSRMHKVCVIAHPHNRAHVEDFVHRHPNENLSFCWVAPPDCLNPWRDYRGTSGLRLHYLIWQHCVLRRARRLQELHGFDMTHHVSWGSISAPPLLWKLPVPFVWGPVGGGQCMPMAFRRYFECVGWPEAVRSLRVQMLPYFPAIRNAVRNAAMILATNRDTEEVLRSAGAKCVTSMLDCGTAGEYCCAGVPDHTETGQITLLWVGKFESLKALPLALESVSLLPDLPIRLFVAGDGPLRSRWQQTARQLGVEGRVTFLGPVDHARMLEWYRKSDIFLFTSLRDSFGMQLLEAMACGLPIVTFDHQGAGTFVPCDAGIKVPVTTPGEAVKGIAAAIRRLAQSPQLRRKMGQAGWSYAQSERWGQRAARMTQLYEQILSHGHRGTPPRKKDPPELTAARQSIESSSQTLSAQ